MGEFLYACFGGLTFFTNFASANKHTTRLALGLHGIKAHLYSQSWAVLL